MKLGERQTSTKMEQIRPDHRARYIFASKYINNGDKVLDAICGIGYGSKLMAMLSLSNIVAFDRDEEAITLAKKYYASPNIGYVCVDFNNFNLPEEAFDVITCFEAIEHVTEPDKLLHILSTTLTEDGMFIISTPNEDIMPWSAEKFPEHVKHFTRDEMEALLLLNGLKVDAFYCQQDKLSFKIHTGCDGNFMIFVCKKV